MNLIKTILLEDWRAKLVCLILATVLWYLIRQNVPGTPLELDWPPAPVWNTTGSR